MDDHLVVGVVEFEFAWVLDYGALEEVVALEHDLVFSGGALVLVYSLLIWEIPWRSNNCLTVEILLSKKVTWVSDELYFFCCANLLVFL